MGPIVEIWYTPMLAKLFTSSGSCDDAQPHKYPKVPHSLVRVPDVTVMRN